MLHMWRAWTFQQRVPDEAGQRQRLPRTWQRCISCTASHQECLSIYNSVFSGPVRRMLLAMQAVKIVSCTACMNVCHYCCRRV